MQDLIIMAMPQEAPNLQKRPDVFFCGVGKINAAATTARLIERYRPKRIINFGTAGGITLGAGLHRATRFVQRDMCCESLGMKWGETPFEPGSECICFDPSGLICSTGDNFVAGHEIVIAADMVDMEAYAIAKVCQQERVTFECWKYITDQADHEAGTAWTQQIAAGEAHYIAKLMELAI